MTKKKTKQTNSTTYDYYIIGNGNVSRNVGTYCAWLSVCSRSNQEMDRHARSDTEARTEIKKGGKKIRTQATNSFKMAFIYITHCTFLIQ